MSCAIVLCMKTPVTFEFCNTARKRLLQMHYESGVGHIGGNLSSLDVLLLIVHEYLGPDDRFILSKGHAAGALYIALWSKGLLHDNDLKTFHRDGTNLPGHPPSIGSAEVPFATGSLGHGLGLAAGMALAKKIQGINDQIYCILSDGECQEGSTWEALIFVAHHQLKNLTILVDHNRLQGFGATKDISSLEPLGQKLGVLSFDFHQVCGHDLNAIRVALDTPANQPKLIVLETIKGKGVSFMENKMEWHYLPLNSSQYIQAIQEIDRL
jgi:transketolase